MTVGGSAKQGVTAFADRRSCLDCLKHTCPVFFPMRANVHALCIASVSTWSEKGPRGLYYHPADNRQPPCKQPKSPLQPHKRKNSSMQRHTIQCNATGARRTSFTDSSLIVWLLLFALNVLMFLVGVNGTPESDYLSAPLTNSTFILYFSFLITWVPTSLCMYIVLKVRWTASPGISDLPKVLQRFLSSLQPSKKLLS